MFHFIQMVMFSTACCHMSCHLFAIGICSPHYLDFCLLDYESSWHLVLRGYNITTKFGRKITIISSCFVSSGGCLLMGIFGLFTMTLP